MKYLNHFLKYSNRDALHNPFQICLYAIAYPIAVIFKTIRFSPNLVTIISTIFAILAFVSLTKGNLLLFCIFWGISYLLDYTDGTLARLTNNIGKSALRIDHISDQLKIIMIFLGFGIYYDCKEFWILTFLSSAIFLFYSFLNHELSNNLKFSRLQPSNDNEENKIKNTSRIKLIRRYLLRKSLLIRYLYIFTFGTVCLINGHTLIIFFFIPFSYEYAVYLLIYFITICLVHSYHRAVSLSRLRKV